jgi:hypothetical protein
MVVILTYTRFTAILRSLGETEQSSAWIDEMKQGALAITHAILFVKQHSVNCIAASLYAMTCFDEKLFPPEEAEVFTALLFDEPPPIPSLAADCLPKNYRMRPWAAPRTKIPAADAAEIKAHIINLYRRFLAEGRTARNWTEPLLRFLQQSPKK